MTSHQNDRPRRLFPNRAYRTLSLACAVLLAVLLAAGNIFYSAPSNWAFALCAWLGVASAVMFAALLVLDTVHPQAITVGRMRGFIVAFGFIVAMAIFAAVLGFFV